MRPLSEILRDMRDSRICKPLSDEAPERPCEAFPSCNERLCRGWTQAEFAELCKVDPTTYGRWEKGRGFERRNVERLQEKLRAIPCELRRKTHPSLEQWEEDLFDELSLRISRGPAPRDIRPSIEADLLGQLRIIQKDGLAATDCQRDDLTDTIHFLEQPEMRWRPYRVGIVSRTICQFEDQLRVLECEAESLLKFSSIIHLRSAAQMAISARDNPSNLNPNFSIDELLEQAAQEARGVLAARGEALTVDEEAVLQDAVRRFTRAIGATTEIPFNTISQLCDEVFQLAARKQKPDHFRQILEILSDRATRAPEQSLFADPAGPEMIVMPLPSSVAIGTSEQEVYMGNLVDPIPPREQPVVQARMNKKFSIGRFPVTVTEFREFCEEAGRRLPDGNRVEEGAKPVVGTNWHDAKEYCRWLSHRTSHPYRLPSEVEWEFACRTIAYADSPFFFGDYIRTIEAVFDESNVDGVVSTATRHFAPNALGLYFMHGNVWEWCEDSFQEGYEMRQSQEPIVCDPSVNKVLRGGSWADPAHMLRSGSRLDASADTQSELIGFRVVRDLSEYLVN